jgi:hypothetical protein
MQKTRTVRARRFIRKMRGEGQAHLLECDDGRRYVVKFTTNPQGGRRILTNELICAHLMGRLGISTPNTILVTLDADFLRENPEVFVRRGHQQVVPEQGPHFGSQHPDRLDDTFVIEFLPDAILQSVGNRDEFLGAMVFDKWVSNADARQAIFYRRAKGARGARPNRWVAEMIDNGLAFQGTDWTFRDSPIQGLYRQHLVYDPDIARAVEPWIQRLMEISGDEIQKLADLVPTGWLAGDGDILARLLARLDVRRERVRDLVVLSFHSFQPTSDETTVMRRQAGVNTAGPTHPVPHSIFQGAPCSSAHRKPHSIELL